jgi:GPH family glycoside/pentoside/hexuronide:cation symporter
MAMVRLSLPTRLAYGFGSVAYGVNNNGLDYFLLIFYSQVLGVDAPLVGLALLLALVFDSLSDPLVGYLSDNTHSRWGRRHPWMYAAALPVAAAYFMLWAPPAELSGNELFPYLFGLAIVVRTLITLYEVPASALIAELTDEYDERTSLVSLRYFFGWAGGTIMATVALAVFLVPTETLSSGLMNRQGYATYGMAASLVILVSILVASLGTHSHIPHLRAPPPKTRFELGRIYRELYETLSSRSFLALFVSTILGAVAAGLAAGLNFYVSGYFWEFSTDQIAVLSVSIIASAFLALFIAPIVSRRLGKKRGAIIVGVIAFSTAPAPVALRLLGVMPENGDPVLFPIILVTAVLDVALIITTQILGTSMVADLVEESEIRTSRRSEGVFFAAMTFTRKAVQGFGVLAATGVLALVSFPKGVAPGLVPEETLFRLGAWYASSLFVIWMLMIACLRFYRIDRGQHEDNLRTLASRG